MPINVKGKQPQNTLNSDQAAAAAKHATETEQVAYGQPQYPAPPKYVPASHAPHLMTGASQQTQVQQVAAFNALRAKLMTGVRDFYLNPGEFARLFFLDGTLVDDNVFDTPMVPVHLLKIGDRFHNLVCNQAFEGRCVMCDGDGSPKPLQLFTVANLMPYRIKSGPNAGKVLKARLQLFAATTQAREKLVRKAQKNGGRLAGLIVEARRGAKLDPRVGDDFDVLEERNYADFIKAFPMLGSVRGADGKWQDAPTKTIDYATAYPHLTNAEIVQLRPDLAGYEAYGQPTTDQAMWSQGVNDSGDSEIPF